MARQLNIGGLYVVIGMLANNHTDYWKLLDEDGNLDPRARTEFFTGGEWDWLYYDLYLHKTENTGTIYRVSFNGTPQLVERNEGGTRLETEGPPHIESRKEVKDMNNMSYIVGFIKFFQFSPRAIERAETGLEELDISQLGALTVNTKVWSFAMLDVVNGGLQHDGYITTKPGPINFPPFYEAVANFVKAHIESALRGEKPRPVLNFASRSFSAPGESA